MTGSPFYGNAHTGFKEQLLLNPELHESPWNELHVTSVTMTGQTVPRAWAPTETFRNQANCQNQLCQNSREHLEIYINQANTQRLLKPAREGLQHSTESAFTFSAPVWGLGPWDWRRQRPYSYRLGLFLLHWRFFGK